MYDEILNNFSLDSDAVSILISMQRDLIDSDISETHNQEKKQKKTEWRKSWIEIVQKGIDELKLSGSDQNFPKIKILKEYEKKLIENENISNKELLLLELVCFQPYFKLDEQKDKSKSIEVDPKIRKKFLRQKAKALGFEKNKALQFESKLKKTQNSLTNTWLQLGIKTGIGISIIAGSMGSGSLLFIGLMSSAIGCSGILVSGARFALAGAAIATKSINGGINKNYKYMFGGGSIIGIGSKLNGYNVLSKINSNDILLNTIKSDVVFQEIIIKKKGIGNEAKTYLNCQRESIQTINQFVNNYSFKIDNRQIKDLKKSIRILEKSYRKNQIIYKKAA
jgi:hypothetical protein